MFLESEITPEGVVLHPVGRFDAHEAPAFNKAFNDALDAGAQDIVIELSRVNFIDSTALAELVRCHRLIDANGGRMSLGSPSDPVRVILEVTSLASFFHVVQPS